VTKEHIRAFVDIFYFVYGGLNQDGNAAIALILNGG
jgi:hypothetical protein